MANPFKYRADHIGSLLRPAQLLKARTDRAAGCIDTDALREVEDAAVREALAMQNEAGTSVVTDGEFRRMDFRSNFADAVEGLSLFTENMKWRAAGGEQSVTVKGWHVVGKLRQHRRLSGDEAAFLKQHTSAPIKICLPAPGFMSGPSRAFKPGVTDKFYLDVNAVGAAMGAIIRSEIEALIAEGVKYIQLDNPGYTFFLDPSNRAKLESAGRDPDKAFEQVLAIDVAALRNIGRPDDVAIGMHLCRGNLSSCWLSEGGYDAIAEKLFNALPVDRFLLEFDDARAGGFEPLRFVPKGKIVVLGLVSTKTPLLEDAEALLDRIDSAAAYVDGDFLAVSPQCGFCSVADGANALTQDDQRRKLELTVDVARMYWGLEI